MQIHTVDKYGGIYSKLIEPIDAVNILPLLRIEPTTFYIYKRRVGVIS